MDARRISLFVLLAFAVATAVLAPAAGAETPEPASAAGAVVEAATATVQSPSPAATESAPEAAAPSPVPAPAPVPPPAPASHPAPSSVSKAAGSAASNVGSTVDRSGAVAETAAATVERVVTSTPSPDLSHANSDLAHTVDTSVRRTTSKSAELVDAAQGKGDEAGPLNHVLDRPLDRVTGAADSLAGTGGSLIETATRPSAASVVPKLDLATEREVLAVNPAVGHELPASSLRRARRSLARPARPIPGSRRRGSCSLRRRRIRRADPPRRALRPSSPLGRGRERSVQARRRHPAPGDRHRRGKRRDRSDAAGEGGRRPLSPNALNAPFPRSNRLGFGRRRLRLDDPSRRGAGASRAGHAGDRVEAAGKRR